MKKCQQIYSVNQLKNMSWPIRGRDSHIGISKHLNKLKDFYRTPTSAKAVNIHLEMGRVTVIKINTNLNSVSRILALNIQKDLSTITKVIAQKPLCLQMNNNNNAIPYTTAII